MSKIGERIKIARSHIHLNQEKFGKMLGVSKNTIINWENNETSIPAIKLIEIANECNLSVSWLLTGELKYFIEWVFQYLDDDTSEGDFARDSLDVSNFPLTNDYHQIKDFLYVRHASDEALEAYNKLWIRYNPAEARRVDDYMDKKAFDKAIDEVREEINGIKAENYDLRKELERKNEELKKKDDSIEALFVELSKIIPIPAQLDTLRNMIKRK